MPMICKDKMLKIAEALKLIRSFPFPVFRLFIYLLLTVVFLGGFPFFDYNKFLNMDSSDDSGNSYTTTPLKSEGSSLVARHQIYCRNTKNPYKTPVRPKVNTTTDINVSKSGSFKSIIIDKMPIYSPPSKNISFIKNPFEHPRLLKQKLSQAFCSPSLFKTVSSPAQNEDFTWSIEDISVLHPAEIDENPSQDFNSWFSPVTENEAQEAINRFFSSKVVSLESPMMSELKKNNCKCDGKEKPLSLDTWSQTDLSLPPILPTEVEAVLSKYYNFNSTPRDEYKDDLDNSNSSTSRKKLLFRNFECLSPELKTTSGANASTPVTARLSSPQISPVSESSPMDISIKNRSVSRLNMTNDVEMQEKENIFPTGSSTPKAMAQSIDSAFASM